MSLKGKTILPQTPPDLTQQSSVQFRKTDFDAFIEQKGYEVVHEKAYKCPCRDLSGGNQLSSCLNCGGSGWVYINPRRSRMAVQSMNKETQYKEWSMESIGRAMITFRAEEEIAYMDRITLQSADSWHNEIVSPIQIEDNESIVTFAFLDYTATEVEAVFKFNSPEEKLQLLTIEQYSVDFDRLIINPDIFQQGETFSIRYKHKPSFIILDINRDIISSQVKNDRGYIRDVPFPRYAVGVREHILSDRQNYAGNRIINNSFTNPC